MKPPPDVLLPELYEMSVEEKKRVRARNALVMAIRDRLGWVEYCDPTVDPDHPPCPRRALSIRRAMRRHALLWREMTRGFAFATSRTERRAAA